MLVITRRVGESIMVGDNVKVTVLQVKGGQVRIGIDAPRGIAVHREEIHERIRGESADGAGDDDAPRRLRRDRPDWRERVRGALTVRSPLRR